MEFIQQNIWLVLLASMSGFMLFAGGLAGRFSGVKQATPQEAVMLMNHEDALILDVREKSEFADGHIGKAKHIPLGSLGGRLADLEKHKAGAIVVVCRSGARSGAACRTLRKAGFEKVYNLAGGMMAWEQAGLPRDR